jgi:hypothetical protein
MIDDPTNSPLKRRLLVLRLATIGGAASVPGVVAAQGQKSGVPDAPRAPAPQPVPQQRPGVTDSDPSDAPGQGRGGNRAPQGGVNDSDPSDPPGQGRGGNRAPQTGLNDSDPSDPPGQGRGGNRAPQPQRPSGPTDTDPSDAPGRGRGQREDLKST